MQGREDDLEMLAKLGSVAGRRAEAADAPRLPTAPTHRSIRDSMDRLAEAADLIGVEHDEGEARLFEGVKVWVCHSSIVKMVDAKIERLGVRLGAIREELAANSGCVVDPGASADDALDSAWRLLSEHRSIRADLARLGTIKKTLAISGVRSDQLLTMNDIAFLL